MRLFAGVFVILAVTEVATAWVSPPAMGMLLKSSSGARSVLGGSSRGEHPAAIRRDMSARRVQGLSMGLPWSGGKNKGNSWMLDADVMRALGEPPMPKGWGMHFVWILDDRLHKP